MNSDPAASEAKAEKVKTEVPTATKNEGDRTEGDKKEVPPNAEEAKEAYNAEKTEGADHAQVKHDEEYMENPEKIELGTQDEECRETVTEEERGEDLDTDIGAVAGSVIDERVLSGDLRFNLPSPASSHSSLASTLPLSYPDESPPSSPIPGGTSSVSRQAILPYLGWHFS